jgi:flagellar biosynthesis/type III secretory pathway chaperone
MTEIAPGEPHGSPLPDAPASPEAAAILAAIDRLEDLLDQETANLGRMSVEELKEVNRRKSLCLLDFVRATRPLAEHAVEGRLRERMQSLREATARNAAVLQTHLDAVREIAGTVAQSLHERDSDGTYSGMPSRVGVIR